MARSRRQSSNIGSSSRSSYRNATPSPKQKRQITVYDAVAGRVSSDGFIPDQPRVSKYRDTLSSSTVPVPPEEALFRRRGAPERYEEDDIYWANRHLTSEQRLPDSDLLKAIHAYTSDFYGRATANGGLLDFESLDETALLGLGILLEEMAEHVLGDTGDLALVEGEDLNDAAHGPAKCPQTMDAEDAESSKTASSANASAGTSDSEAKQRRKRRKTRHTPNDDG
ncbi:hypothetical protein JMJ35_001161 [Cladonia borealis]|uniref:Uncharacterized protein n=1 Tax=Cladonia borealis TaxID=184061 RepID=A0AA39R819_9LECA|nr:hypothetical protein JMJ35_001161 [Cladonia borealis]